MPKVMVPIAPGKPLLEHTIEWFRDQGITDFVVNIHYLPEVITSYFGDGKKWGVRIIYSDETKQLLETAGALKKAEHLLHDDFLFMYGDEMHFFHFAPLIDLHIKNKAMGTTVFKVWHVPQDGEVAEFDPITKKITAWYARPHHITEPQTTPTVNAGLYVLSKRILDYISAGIPTKLDGAVIPKALAAGESFYAFPTNEPILDIGTPEQYERAKEYYRKTVTGPKR